MGPVGCEVNYTPLCRAGMHPGKVLQHNVRNAVISEQQFKPKPLIKVAECSALSYFSTLLYFRKMKMVKLKINCRKGWTSNTNLGLFKCVTTQAGSPTYFELKSL